MNEQAKAIIKMIREAGYVTVGEGVDKKDVSLTHDQVEGLAKRILTEQLGECEPFERVSLENVLRADADGMPVFRECFEHETLMSFYDDDGNKKFIEWWEVEGKYLFGKYYGTEPAPQDNKCPITGYEAFAELKPAPQEDECPSCGGVGKKYTIDCFTHIRELETCGRCLGTGIDKDWETWHETQITKRKIEECMNSRGDELIDSVEWLTIMDWLDKDGE